MIYLKLAALLLANLPALIKLINTLDENAKAAGTERKVQDELQKITDAFKARDSEALRRIFSSDD